MGLREFTQRSGITKALRRRQSLVTLSIEQMSPMTV
jgi:hypothetical protein